MTIEQALADHATKRLDADERLLYVGTARFELGRVWFIAMGVGFVLGIFPGLIIGLIAIAHARESPYIVATTKRLFTYMGRPAHGLIFPRKVIDLGTVRAVDVKAVDGGSSVTLVHADASKTVLSLVPRGATRGLQATSAAQFHDEFPRWLAQSVSSFTGLTPTSPQPSAPRAAEGRTLRIVGVAVGVVLLCFGLFLVVKVVIRRAEQQEYEEETRAAAERQAERFRALGADPAAQAFFAALAQWSTRPRILLAGTPPSDAEIAALEAAAAALPTPPHLGSGFRSSGYSASSFRLSNGDANQLETRMAVALGESPQARPVEVVPEGTALPTHGQLTIDLHVRPAAGRTHPLRGGDSCILIEGTVNVRAETEGAPAWVRSIELPPMSADELTASYSMRSGGTRTNCATAQAIDLHHRAMTAVTAALIAP